MNQQKTLAIVPAAGIGARMGAGFPKQYLPLEGQTILGHTLDRLLSHQDIDGVIVALHPDDIWFENLPQARHPKLTTVIGGKERANSVLAALNVIDTNCWVLVHDAARPCLHHEDINQLLASRNMYPQGAILAIPVRDTMKRAQISHDGKVMIEQTICRENLWHALTPQLFPADILAGNITAALTSDVIVTDEASAMEWAGINPGLISGRADNIKITHPDDLPLAALFIQAQRQIEKTKDKN